MNVDIMSFKKYNVKKKPVLPWDPRFLSTSLQLVTCQKLFDGAARALFWTGFDESSHAGQRAVSAR